MPAMLGRREIVGASFGNSGLRATELPVAAIDYVLFRPIVVSRSPWSGLRPLLG